MATTVSTVTKGRANEVWGGRHVLMLRFTFDDSYPTGGEALDLKQYGAQGEVQAVFIAQHAPVNAGYVVQYDKTNEKLVVYWTSNTTDGEPLVEVTNATNLSTLVVDLLVISK